MITVFKYEISFNVISLQLPEDAEPLFVEQQNSGIFLWAKVDTEKPLVSRTIHPIGTGHEFPKVPVSFLGSLMFLEGSLVIHFFIEDLPIASGSKTGRFSNEISSSRSIERNDPLAQNQPALSSKQLQMRLEQIFRDVDGMKTDRISEDPGTDSEYIATYNLEGTHSVHVYAGNYLSGTLPQLIIESPEGVTVFELSYSKELTDIENYQRHRASTEPQQKPKDKP